MHYEMLCKSNSGAYITVITMKNTRRLQYKNHQTYCVIAGRKKDVTLGDSEVKKKPCKKGCHRKARVVEV